MKMNHGFFCMLFSLALAACDDDAAEPPINSVLDTVNPVVEILTPAANDSLPMIDVIEIFAEVTDDRRLNNVQVVLTEPGGGSQKLQGITITRSGDYKKYTLSGWHRIPKHAATGEYTVTVEAKDEGQNVTKKAVGFNLHTSGIRSAAFVRAFGNALVNSKFSETLDGLGYNFWDAGYSFNKDWFSTFLYLMVTTDREYSISEAEWDKFIADFGVRNQTWTTWDENRDGNLNDEEFHEGISSLNFFDDWDENQDDLVYIDELAAGVFILWDFNKDNMLNREEYLEKFYTYLSR